MFVIQSRCAFASANAQPLPGGVQLVGQISTGWRMTKGMGGQFHDFDALTAGIS
jgi:hypothetical protein